MMRTRRRTASALSLAAAAIAHSEAKQIDEGRGDAERAEDDGQPRPGAEQLVQPPASARADADGDGEHPSDGRGLDQPLYLTALALVVTEAHEGASPAPPRPAWTRPPAGSSAADRGPGPA